MRNKQNGITLVALVITIIILLLLAGISIASLTNIGLFSKTEQAKQEQKNAQIKENITLNEYENWLANYISGTGTTGGDSTEGGTTGDGQIPPPDPTVETNPATTITEAQSDYMLDKEVNSSIQDTYGNKIVVPAGFKITAEATTVDEGIVIEDENGNQFVWIPVPENGFIKGENGANVNNVAIILNRYTFTDDTNATPVPQGTDVIENYFEELATSTYGNTTAKDIDAFIESVEENEGYYIGRYEARKGTSGLTLKATDTVYSNITQPNAANLCRNMYTSTEFTSDLMNSYAWDTATLFLQVCGDNPRYSRQTSLNTGSLETKGTTTDKQCNVYDMASNCFEWTTEASSCSGFKFSFRGGGYNTNSYYTSIRNNGYPSYITDNKFSYRPLLFM